MGAVFSLQEIGFLTSPSDRICHWSKSHLSYLPKETVNYFHRKDFFNKLLSSGIFLLDQLQIRAIRSFKVHTNLSIIFIWKTSSTNYCYLEYLFSIKYQSVSCLYQFSIIFIWNKFSTYYCLLEYCVTQLNL